MKLNTLCPVSNKMINKWVPRMNAILTFLALLVFFFSQNLSLLFFLGIDFALRGFGASQYSPLAMLSRRIISILPLTPELENAGPKFFAARIGMVFSVFVLFFALVGLSVTANVFAGIFAFFVTLEAAFGFCTACYIYPHLLRACGNNENNPQSNLFNNKKFN